MYASFLTISDALHLGIFDQPETFFLLTLVCDEYFPLTFQP